MFKSYKQRLITQYYKLDKESTPNNSNKVYGYNEKTNNWHCLECGENMGNNSRQLCGKSYCYYN